MKIFNKQNGILLALILFSQTIRANDTTHLKPKMGIEFLMNVSNAISRFAGNGPVQNIVEEPFLMGFKVSSINRRRAFRFGINFFNKNTKENISGTERENIENSWAPLIGYEWRKKLGTKFEFYGGLDFRYYNQLSKTKTFIPQSQTIPASTNTFTSTNKGIGAGPFCGFVFYITHNVTLQTEGNFYLNSIKVLRKFQLDDSTPDILENKSIVSVSPTAPSSIFLVLKF